MDVDDSGFSGGLTALQREVMERRRAGEDVELVTTKLPDGSRKAEVLEKVVPNIETVSMEDAAASFSSADAPDAGELPELDEVVAAPAEPVPATGAVEPVEEPPMPAVCPGCGFKHGDPVYNPTEADKQYFIESVLGDAPYEKTVELLGGKLRVNCVAPDRQSLDTAFRLLQWCFHEKKFNTAVDERDYYTRIHASMIVRGVFGGKGGVTNFEPVTSGKPWTSMDSEDFSAMLDAVIARTVAFGNRYPFIAIAVAQFLGVYNELVKHSLAENFWTGASRE